MKQFYVYILANRKGGTLYTGVTNDIARRSWENRNKAKSGFTARYNVERLVCFEIHDTSMAAIRREKTIKRWPRKWKNDLIEKENPEWFDLFRRLNH